MNYFVCECYKYHLFTSVLILCFQHRLSVLFMDDLGQISPSKAILAGSVAGMLAAIVIYPTDVIKTRLIIQNSLEPTYRGIIHALYTVYYQEGFRPLYRGVSLSILGMSFFHSCYIAIYSIDSVKGSYNYSVCLFFFFFCYLNTIGGVPPHFHNQNMVVTRVIRTSLFRMTTQNLGIIFILRTQNK